MLTVVHSLKLTAKSPKMDGWKMSFLWGGPAVRELYQILSWEDIVSFGSCTDQQLQKRLDDGGDFQPAFFFVNENTTSSLLFS